MFMKTTLFSHLKCLKCLLDGALYAKFGHNIWYESGEIFWNSMMPTTRNQEKEDKIQKLESEIGELQHHFADQLRGISSLNFTTEEHGHQFSTIHKSMENLHKQSKDNTIN